MELLAAHCEEESLLVFQTWGIDEPTPLEVLEQTGKELEDRMTIIEKDNIGQPKAT